jgi:4-hydroxy-4-methyl-2-oxoglutarate aldolase
MHKDPSDARHRPSSRSKNGGRAYVAAQHIEALRQFDTCTIANAIEGFRLRLRNEGYTLPGLRCLTGAFPTIIGFAATCKVKVGEPPLTGGHYFHRDDWWEAIEALPTPRIAVIQDMDPDPEPSPGACVGEVHAAILQAFECEGVITNGAVRNLPAVAEMGFRMFARHVAVSHAYMHVMSYGGEVEIFGLKVRSGDLLAADCHGVINIPLDIVAELPAAAKRIHAEKRRIVDLCVSPGFTPEKLRAALQKEKV